MSPVRYKLRFYILEDDILHSNRRDTLNSYIRFRLSADTAAVGSNWFFRKYLQIYISGDPA
jgi:hypothetical protein